MKQWAFCLGLVIGATVVGVALAQLVVPEPEPETRCFWGHFDSIEKYQEVVGPPKAWIELNGNEVRVFVPCRGT